MKLGFFAPLNILSYFCARGRLEPSKFYSNCSNLLSFIYSPWSIYCFIRFFNGRNNTKEEAGFLYAGMLYLMIEGILYLLTIVLVIVFIVCFILLVYFLVRGQRQQEEERLERNVQISNLINNVDYFNFTGQKSLEGEQ